MRQGIIMQKKNVFATSSAAATPQSDLSVLELVMEINFSFLYANVDE